MARMVKGTRTNLTYKVTFYRYLSLWIRADVHEPYMTKPRFFGLWPARLAYRHVFDGGAATEIRAEHPKPDDYKRLAENTVREYETHKLAWEAAPVDR